MIYKNQTKIDFVVNVGADITRATAALLKYIKPSGQEGSFTCTITNTTTGEISYTVISGDIDEYGNWVFWSSITFDDGLSLDGDPTRIHVFKRGEV